VLLTRPVGSVDQDSSGLRQSSAGLLMAASSLQVVSLKRLNFLWVEPLNSLVDVAVLTSASLQ
jgi:hypothetical protein